MLDDNMREYINKFQTLALAVSGGRDSMALLDWFCQNVSKKNFFAVTVQHNLRGDEGIRDRDFVVNYCKAQGVRCKAYDEDIPTFCKAGGYTLEQGARIRRRQIFAQLVECGEAQRVVTAHHMQDNVESILMHIFRGSGIRGLRGMSLDDGTLLRPMLKTSREDVDDYIKRNAVPYVDDSTNKSQDYSRNKLRLSVMPLLREIYRGVDGNVIRLADRANELCNHLDGICKGYDNRLDGIFIPLAVLQGDKVIASYTVINAVDEITTRVDLTQKHINSILDLAEKNRGASVSLPFGLTAYRDEDGVVLAKLQTVKIYDGCVKGYGDYDLGDKVLRISAEKSDSLRCDMDKLEGCDIRNRRIGDVFKRYKGKSKSLGDYLTDIKIPRRNRESIVVLAKENEVYALPQYEIGDIVKIDGNTRRVAYISIIKK